MDKKSSCPSNTTERTTLKHILGTLNPLPVSTQSTTMTQLSRTHNNLTHTPRALGPTRSLLGASPAQRQCASKTRICPFRSTRARATLAGTSGETARRSSLGAEPAFLVLGACPERLYSRTSMICVERMGNGNIEEDIQDEEVLQKYGRGPKKNTRNVYRQQLTGVGTRLGARAGGE